MSYTITIEPSGHRFSAEPGESVHDAALRHGIVIPYSCRSGTCKTCMGKVVEGSVTYPGGAPPACLDEKEVAVGQALFCMAQPAGDLVIEVREILNAADIPARRMRCRVVRMARFCHDVMALYLKLPDNDRLPFLPGQHLDILLRDGRRRSFSIANPPHDDALLEMHVRHIEGGEFSEHAFYNMQDQALLRIEGPYGTFHIRDNGLRPVLMLAGSTGIAPVKCMLAHMLHTGDPRPVHLFWGARTRQDLYMDRELRAWADTHAGLHYTPCLSDPQPEDDWLGRIGLVHNMLLQDYPDLRGYDVYIAGPPAMIAAARRDFVRHGVEHEHFFWNAFEFAADSRADLTATAAEDFK